MAVGVIFTKGGILVYLIVICSIFALSSFLERIIKLQSIRIDADAFLERIEKMVIENKVNDAIQLCLQHKSPVARIVLAGLRHIHESKERMMAYLEESALHEFPQLESKLVVLSTVAHITPLLGLLGTVNGMIRAFQVIQEKSLETGLASPSDLAEGIWMALITTALGLAVAIPTIVAYNYIYRRVQKIKFSMEKAANRILTLSGH